MRFTRRIEQNSTKSSNEKQIVDFGRKWNWLEIFAKYDYLVYPIYCYYCHTRLQNTQIDMLGYFIFEMAKKYFKLWRSNFSLLKLHGIYATKVTFQLKSGKIEQGKENVYKTMEKKRQDTVAIKNDSHKLSKISKIF